MNAFLLVVFGMAYAGAATGFYSSFAAGEKDSASLAGWRQEDPKMLRVSTIALSVCWPFTAAHIWAKTYLSD